jgi:hypothetical protein
MAPLRLALDCEVEVNEPVPESLFDATADSMARAHRGHQQAATPGPARAYPRLFEHRRPQAALTGMSDLRITTGPFCPDCTTVQDAPEGAAAADDTRRVPAHSGTSIPVGPSALGSMSMARTAFDVAPAPHPDDVALANKAAEQLGAGLPVTLSQDAKSDVAVKVQQVLQAARDQGLGPLDRLDISVKANGVLYGVGIRAGVSQPVVSHDASGTLQSGGNPKVSIGVSTPALPAVAIGGVATYQLNTGVSSGAIFGTATRLSTPGGGWMDYKTNGSTVQLSTNVFSTQRGVPTIGLETSFEVPTARQIAEHLTGTTPQQQLWTLNDIDASQHALNKRNDALWSKQIDARYDQEISDRPELKDVINLERERAHLHRNQSMDDLRQLTIERFQAIRAPIQAQLPKLPAN